MRRVGKAKRRAPAGAAQAGAPAVVGNAPGGPRSAGAGAPSGGAGDEPPSRGDVEPVAAGGADHCRNGGIGAMGSDAERPRHRHSSVLLSPRGRVSRPAWRVGRTLGRTLYLDGVCIGMLDDPRLAALVVEGLALLLDDESDADRSHAKVTVWRLRLRALRVEMLRARGRSRGARRARAAPLGRPPERA